MLHSPMDFNDNWADFVVFPARLVVKAPPDLREPLYRFGRTLYALLMRQSGPVSTGAEGSALRQELEALFTELALVRDICLADPALREPGKHLAEALATRGGRFYEVVGALPTAFRELPSYSFRPFLRTQLDVEHLEPVVSLATILESLLVEQPCPADPADWTSALIFDLRWVKLVLSRHLAAQGEVSALDRETTHLASLADDLAGDLDRPMNELVRVGEFE